MKIQKFILTMAALLAAGSAAAAGLSAGDVPAFYPGYTATVPVSANLPQGASALQFTVVVPAQFSLSSLEVNKDAAPDHLLQAFQATDSTCNYVIYSNSNTSFASGADYLFELKLRTATDAAAGEHTLKIANVIASDASGVETRLPDLAVTIPVYVKVDRVTVEPLRATLAPDDELQLAASVQPADAVQDVTWESSDPEVATVSDDGLVHARALGSARITARSKVFPAVYGYSDILVAAVKATSITLDKENIDLRMGSTAALKATVSPENTTDPSVVWSSSDISIVTVDDAGSLTPVKPGKASVTAATTDGSNLKATCEVTVLPPPATSVNVNKPLLELMVMETFVLKATVLPADADQTVEWSCSDDAIATVAADGTVTALAEGTVTIWATATDGSGVAGTCSLTVVAAKVTSITLNKTALGMRIGESETLLATVLPDYAADRSLAWWTDNASVAHVDQTGKITAVALGEATITANALDGSGVSAACKVTVTNALSSGITIDKTEATLRVRQELKLVATVVPDGAVDDVNWNSSAPDVATVDADGTVTALAPGKAIISATTADGTSLTASCTITVEPALAESVTLDRHELTMKMGQSETLVATVLPDYAGNHAVTWQSSAPGVALVDSNGRVIAMSEGSAVITATAADGSGVFDQCTVTVERIRATSIVIDPQELTIEQGDTVQVKVTVLPADAETGVVWESLNPDIASVDADGKIAGVEMGTAVITAATTDGSNLTATCIVTVTESTGIAYIECDHGAVRVENGTEIVVSGVIDSTIVYVVNTSGVCVYAGNARRISGLIPGLYIVIVDNTATKVILR